MEVELFIMNLRISSYHLDTKIRVYYVLHAFVLAWCSQTGNKKIDKIKQWNKIKCEYKMANSLAFATLRIQHFNC